MKLFARPKHFSEAIASMTIISRVLGLRVFEYPRGRPRPKLSLIYFLIIYVTYFKGSMNVEELYYANVKLMKLEYVLYKLLWYVVIMSVIVKMFLGWWYSKQFKVCYKKIFEIDETLRQLGLMVNYNRIYFVMIGVVIVWITITFTVCTMFFIHFYSDVPMDILTIIYIILVFTFAVIVNSIYIFEFYIFANCLQMKFKLVNELLGESLTNLSLNQRKLGIFEMNDYTKIINTERKCALSMKTIFRWRRRVQSRVNVPVSDKQHPIYVSQIESHAPSQFENQCQIRNRFRKDNSTMTKCQKRIHLLQIIRQMHLELCKVSKIVCTILGVQTAWEIGIIIMFLTGALYNLYIRYVMNQHKVKGLLAQTIITLLLCCFHIIKAVCLNRACKVAADEGNKTIEIIHAIYSCNTDTNMQEEIQQFGIQILQSPVTFTAFGITLDNHVLTMILKIVTTYMVIMIQVSNTLESNNAIIYTHF